MLLDDMIVELDKPIVVFDNMIGIAVVVLDSVALYF